MLAGRRRRRTRARGTSSPILAAALFAALLGLALAPSAHAADRASLARAIERIVGGPDEPPGASVQIRRPGENLYIARGEANVRTGRRPNAAMRTRIASVAKAFNGAVVLAGVSRGELELSDTVGDWVPKLLPRARSVTLRQLLTHTSGVKDYIRDKRFIADLTADPEQYISPRGLVAYVADKRLNFRPGARYEYSDTENVVAGLIAMRASGLTYRQLLTRRVYRPLGLLETRLPDIVRMPRPYMRGYEIDPPNPPEDVSETINPALAWASGGIVSTVRDLGRFFRGYVGGELFDARTKRLQRRFISGESQPPGPGPNASGAGLFRYRTRCGVVFGHTGSFPGYRQFAASSPDGKRSIAFVVNAQIVPGSGSAEVSKQIRRVQERAVCLMYD